jgi:hypothetical protein
MKPKETCTHGGTPNTCNECTIVAVLSDPAARQAYLENRDFRVRLEERARIVAWLMNAPIGLTHRSCASAIERAIERGDYIIVEKQSDEDPSA